MPFALNWALANVVDETKGQKKRSWNWTRMEDGKAVELLWCTRCPIDSWRNYTLYTILQQSKFFSQFSACRKKPVGIGLCRWSCWNISIYEVRSIVSQGVFEACVFFLNLPNLLLLDTKNCPGDLFEFSRAEHLGQKGASPEGLWCILWGLEQLQHEKIL